MKIKDLLTPLSIGLLALAIMNTAQNNVSNIILGSDDTVVRVSYPLGIFDTFLNRHTQYDITPPSEIKTDGSIQGLLNILREADDNDTVIIHINGIGGDVATAVSIINAMHESKAKVVADVSGAGFSSWAFIASQADELIMRPNSFLMFHKGIVQEPCKTEGLDIRGVPNAEVCLLDEINDNTTSNELIDGAKLLTPEEKQSIKAGHEIYIRSDEYERRIHHD
jgi:hypothetical protein